MTHYEIVALAVFVFCLIQTGTHNFIGTVGVSLLWPMMVTVLTYSSLKKLVMTSKKRPFHISELEVGLCMIVSGPLFIWALYLTHNPFAVQLFDGVQK